MHNLTESVGSGVEDFKQCVIDFFPDIIYVYDVDQEKLTYTTDKISSVLGFTSEDLKEWKYDLMKLVRVGVGSYRGDHCFTQGHH
jgi:hypothetical protein